MKISKFTKHIVAPGLALIVLLVAWQSAVAATETEKRTAIDNGLAWLATQQQVNGSWVYSGGVEDAATTGAALLAFIEEKDNWAVDYSSNVTNGINYLLNQIAIYPISPQPAGDPDTDGNGIGVKFVPGGNHSRDTYVTGLALPAIAKVAAATPNALVTTGPLVGRTDGTGAGGAWTYKDVVQNTVDYFAYGQVDLAYGNYRGGWRYYANNSSSDNSTAQWPPIAMLYALAVPGVTVPNFVKSELTHFIDYIQNSTSGGSGYTSPTNLVNEAKTGGLLAEMVFAGYNGTSSGAGDLSDRAGALTYLNANWTNFANSTWNGNFNHPYAMWSIYKGLALQIGLNDTTAITNLLTDCGAGRGGQDAGDICNWWEDYSEWLVLDQNADGSWTGYSSWPSVLSTPWFINILAATEIPNDPFDVEVEKDYRYTSVCFERDNDLDGSFGEDPVEYLDGVALLTDNDNDGLIDEDGIDCDPSDTGYELPVTGTDPEAYTLEAVLKKNGTVSSYNPGQYYAVSTVKVTRFNESVESVMLEIVEDYRECTTATYPVSERNPKNGGGSVVVVEVKDGVAYQIYDAMSDAITFNSECGEECSATAAFEYSFEDGQDEAMLLVYVKFAPGLKGVDVSGMLPLSCENINSAKLEVFEEGEEEPVFVIDPADDEDASANAWLTVVEK